MKIDYVLVINNFWQKTAEVDFTFDSLEVSLKFSAEYIEVLRVFNENLKLMIENYGDLHERFGRTFWSDRRDYQFDLSSDSKMTITVEGSECTTCKIVISELEDLKRIYFCLNGIYEILDKEEIPNRYNLEFQ